MTEPRPHEHDGGRPAAPTSIARWAADHRVLTRTVGLLVCAALVLLLVSGLFSGETRWYNWLQLPIWVWLTAGFGWVMPRAVDAWRRAPDGTDRAA